MKNQILIYFTLVLTFSSCSASATVFTGKTIHFKASDGVQVTADYYDSGDKNAPLILLFHQANFSRGEYREIAPKLNKLGFNCLAIDQRSGLTVNGVKNETHKAAKALNKPTKYVNAIPDLVATYHYAKNDLKSSNIIIWGSSYSAALVLYLASQYPNDIKGVLSFSPGEYFTIDAKKIETFSDNIACPVFVTSAQNERESWQTIYDNISSKKEYFLPKLKGNHGSKALWKTKESHAEYWTAVENFLNQFTTK